MASTASTPTPAPKFSGFSRFTTSQAGSPHVAAGPSRPNQLNGFPGLGRVAGRGGKGLGKGNVLRRHRKAPKDTIRGISKGDIRRLARRGGIKRISAIVYEDIRSVLKDRLTTILHQIVALLQHSNRKTIVVRDVIFVLNRMGKPLYGFDPAYVGQR